MNTLQTRSVLAALALATLIGCGGGNGGDGRAGVESVVSDFINAANERDFERVCELMTAEARRTEVGASSPSGCVEGLSGSAANDSQGSIEIEFQDVRISGERAAAEIRVKDEDSGNSNQSLELVRDEGRWRISEFR